MRSIRARFEELKKSGGEIRETKFTIDQSFTTIRQICAGPNIYWRKNCLRYAKIKLDFPYGFDR